MSQTLFLNFPNGTLNLATNEFNEKKNNSDEYPCIFVEYENKNENKMEYLKNEFINKIFPSIIDREVHLQYDAKMLFGFPSNKVMINFDGKGKSLYTGFLAHIMGTYAGRVPNSLIIEEEEKDCELQSMMGKRFLLIDDIKGKINSGVAESYFANDCFVQANYQINCTIIPEAFTESSRFILTRFPIELSIMIEENILSDEFVKRYGCQFIHILLEQN